MIKNVVALSVFLVVSGTAVACTHVEQKGIETLIQELRSSNRNIDFSFESLSPLCKSWPAVKDASIIGVPYFDPNVVSSDSDRRLGIYLAVIEAPSGNIVQKFDDANVALADQFIAESISIDTAAYRISSRQLAFGIRFIMSGPSRINAIKQENLNLYLSDHGNLKKILSSLVIGKSAEQRDIGCEEFYSKTESTVSMSKSKLHDWNNIHLSEHLSSYRMQDINGKCSKLYGKRSFKMSIYEYDGSRYKIPENLKSMTALD